MTLLSSLDAFAITGNDWNVQPKDVQGFYILGVTQGWREASVIEGNIRKGGSSMTFLVDCLKQGMTYNQVIAIVERYMREHPEKWHSQMSTLIFVGLSEMCTQRAKNE